MKSTCKYCNTERYFVIKNLEENTDIAQVGIWSKGTPFCEYHKRDPSATPFLICDVSNEKNCGLYEPKDKVKK